GRVNGFLEFLLAVFVIENRSVFFGESGAGKNRLELRRLQIGENADPYEFGNALEIRLKIRKNGATAANDEDRVRSAWNRFKAFDPKFFGAVKIRRLTLSLEDFVGCRIVGHRFDSRRAEVKDRCARKRCCSETLQSLQFFLREIRAR